MARKPGVFTKARPAKDIRQRAWQAMRIMKRFTTFDIRATAGIGESNLRNYIKALHKAGYLALVKERRSGENLGHAVWRLARDSGPKHPILRVEGGMFDPNTGLVWMDGKEVPNDNQ